MKIKNKITILIFTFMGSLMILSVMLYLMLLNQKEISQKQEIRYMSYLAGDELRQSSDDLTKLARTYVITGDDKYEKMYWDILDIRNGKKARPENYNRIYWDLVIEYGTNPTKDTDIKSLKKIMEELGFSENEFKKLEEAQNNSDSLVTTETIAMNAVKGLYDDGKGNYTVKKEPDREMAIRIMHDINYHKEKAKIMKPVNEFLEQMENRTKKDVDNAIEKGNKYFIATLISVIFFGIIFIIVLIISLDRFILIPIRNSSQVSEDLSRGTGDLTIRLDESKKDEIGEMSRNFNMFLNKLLEIIKEIKEYSFRVASGTGQLRATMQEISNSVDELRISANTTATAVEEMSSTTNAVFSNVEELSKSSEQTLKLAENGGNAVKSTIKEIHKIKDVVDIGRNNVRALGEKTNEIGEVVTVINEIASQTNLLALNAAIEAARAGKAGKGFEVVAEEVRKLSEKTTDATKEIAKTIKDIQSKSSEVIIRMEEVNAEVEEGVKTANKTGSALEEIVNQTVNLRDMVNMIVNSTREQSSVSNEIAKQTEKVTQSIEENGRAVEQSSEAIREIADIAEKLSQLVNQFKVDEGNTEKSLKRR